MQNSSKKSLRPSPSQPDKGNKGGMRPQPGAQASGPVFSSPQATPQTTKMAPGRPISHDQGFGSSGGKRLRLPMGRGYTVTLEGRQFGLLVLSAVLYIFAAFVASDWIYLLSAAFLVALVLGTLLPFFELAGLSASYLLPQEVAALETATVRVNIKRHFKFGPISWVVPTRALRMTVNMTKRAADGKPSDIMVAPDPVLIDKLESDEWYSFPTPSLIRGVYFLESVELSTCFPFGITWWSRTVKMTEKSEIKPSITVYPDVLPISGNFLYLLTGIVSPMGHATSNSVITHQSSSFRSVREFRSGDSMRHIHWASTARQGKMLVREFDSETLPVFDILLNLRSNYRSKEQFELTVKLVNSLMHLGHSLGHMPRLLLNPSTESGDLHDLLIDLPHMPPGLALTAEILARVEPITKVAANRKTFDEESENSVETWDHTNDRPMVAVLPTNDKIIKFSPGRGDVVCLPVEVVEVSPSWQDDDIPLPGMEPQAVEKASNTKSRGASVKKTERAELGPTSGTVLARIEWEGDFEGL
ncbi:hypothetical protein BH11CYA1_BH11CYA1_41790 [soil metagenome]